MDRPNILYLHSHDSGRYIQPHGFNIPTPNLQALAEDGVLFRQNFCGNPTCSASRACLLTGMAAHSNGMFGLAHRGFRLNDYSRHLVHTLHAHGYTSALSGIQHVAYGDNAATETIGYHRQLDPSHRGHEGAIAFLRHPPGQPFFLSVGLFETHRKYPEPRRLDDARYLAPPLPLPDTPETRYDMACYRHMAHDMDEKMGRVLDALDQGGLADNTLVICTTDHGIAWPRMKCNLHDSGIGVMLIMRGPGGFTGGKVVDQLTSHVDIFPTICEVCDIPKPAWLQGVSLLPTLDGRMVRDEVQAEVNVHAAVEPMRCIRTKRWKYIRRYAARKQTVLPNCDGSVSRDLWREHGWDQLEHADEMLFDTIFDPGEANNLVADPRAAAALADLRGRLQAWMERTDDPMLAGRIPIPEGAKLCDPAVENAEDTFIYTGDEPDEQVYG